MPIIPRLLSARPWRRVLPIFLELLLLLTPAAVLAGGGPENVLLVVNRLSPASLTIANYYQQIRYIPAGNVLTLALDPKAETTDIITFRQKVLQPVIDAIEKRRLTDQIDYVVYSSDFPSAIALGSDIAKFQAEMQKLAAKDPAKAETKPAWPQQFTPVGSITGLTYLYSPVLRELPGYFEPRSNEYVRGLPGLNPEAPSLGFKSSLQFGPQGTLVSSGGRRYLLSVMLGVTAGRGNTLREVLTYLRRSAAADGTHPRGTIYYMRSKDVRSEARDNNAMGAVPFAAAVEELKKLGVAAEVIPAVLPLDKSDVQGAMLGTPAFDWKSSGSTILPGAICENFTSYGGNLRAGASYQTPLSEFLRYGAAGSSGTVTEPFALQPKFPYSLIHVHYARGCSLAEAFYQSVSCPYQLLIVGDPLCRPWANIPAVKVAGVEPGATVKDTLKLDPAAEFPKGSQADHFELFIDGWLTTRCPPGGSLVVDTKRLADGYHELRVVAVEAGPIQSQGRQIMSIATANYGREITASITPASAVEFGKPLTITAESPGSESISVLHNSHLLGTISGEKGQLEVDSSQLGYGTTQLRFVGVGKGDSTSYAWAAPIEVTVKAKGD